MKKSGGHGVRIELGNEEMRHLYLGGDATFELGIDKVALCVAAEAWNQALERMQPVASQGYSGNLLSPT